MGVARREPALAQRLMSQYLQTDDADLLERSYRTWIEEMDRSPTPRSAGIQTILDQRAAEIPAARTADPRDYVDDRILRDLRSQRLPRPRARRTGAIANPASGRDAWGCRG